MILNEKYRHFPNPKINMFSQTSNCLQIFAGKIMRWFLTQNRFRRCIVDLDYAFALWLWLVSYFGNSRTTAFYTLSRIFRGAELALYSYWAVEFRLWIQLREEFNFNFVWNISKFELHLSRFAYYALELLHFKLLILWY